MAIWPRDAQDCALIRKQKSGRFLVSAHLSSHPPDFLTGHMARRWPHAFRVSQSRTPWGYNSFDFPFYKWVHAQKAHLKSILAQFVKEHLRPDSFHWNGCLGTWTSQKYHAKLLPHSFILRSIIVSPTQAIQRIWSRGMMLARYNTHTKSI